MDVGQVATVVGFVVSIFAILFGIAALMWQINNQSSRLEAKIDAQGKELRDEIREQGRRVSQVELGSGAYQRCKQRPSATNPYA